MKKSVYMIHTAQEIHKTMIGKKYKKGLAVLLTVLLAAQLPVSRTGPFHLIDSYAYTGTATVKASSLNVRSGAGTGYQAVGRLAAGSAVTIVGETKGTDGKTWYQIQYKESGGSVKSGYVSASYIRLPVSYSTDSDFESYLNRQGFPESYKNGLRQLHSQYPSWVFVAKNTGLDWNTVIENESVLGRNLVAKGSISSWKSVENGAYNWDTSTWTGFDGSNWVAASGDIIKYYMDPRNFLDETYVFQFLSHEYNGASQTKEGLDTMISGTFLSGTTDSTGTAGSDFSGSSGSGGPGASSGSAEVSTKGPGGSSGQTGDVNRGPGVSGSAGTTSPGSSSQSNSGSTGAEVSLEAPHASITPKERNLVGDNVTVVTGADAVPGAKSSDNSGQASQSPSDGRAVQPGSSPSSGNTSSDDVATTGPGGSGIDASSGNAPSGNTDTAAPTGNGTASYSEILMKAAAQSGVSPYVLAAMILQEQGTGGTSPLISGTYSGYAGYYNFFNVEAYQSGSTSAIQMGLRYASQSGSYGRPWNTVEKSILGGAQNYGDNYVKAGQNTFYLKKFNVQGANPYKHQYMSNVQGAASEGAKLAQAYTAQLKNTALEFHIPVYNNMPEQACLAPTGDGSPNNKLSALEISGFSLTPSFNWNTDNYNLIVDNSVGSISVNASPADSQAQVSGAGTVNLAGQTTDIQIAVTAQNGSVRTYSIHVVKQAGGPVSGSGGTVYAPDGGSSQSPGGSTGSPGSSTGGPGVSNSGEGPGGSNVTIVEVGS